MKYWNKKPINVYILGLAISIVLALGVWGVLLIPNVMMSASGTTESQNTAHFLMAYSFIFPFLVGYCLTMFLYLKIASKEKVEDEGHYRIIFAVLSTVLCLGFVGLLSVYVATFYESPNHRENERKISHIEKHTKDIQFYERVAKNEEAIDLAIKDIRLYVGLGTINLHDDGQEGIELSIQIKNPFQEPLTESQKGYITLINEKGEVLSQTFSTIVFGYDDSGHKTKTILNDDVIGQNFDHSLKSMIKLDNGGEV